MRAMNSHSMRQRPGSTGPAAAHKSPCLQYAVPSTGRGGTASTSGRGQFTLAPVCTGHQTQRRVFNEAAALQQGGLGLSELLDKDLAEPILTPRRIMNRRIKSCRSLSSLSELVQDEISNFDHQNVAHALSRIAKMVQDRTRGNNNPHRHNHHTLHKHQLQTSSSSALSSFTSTTPARQQQLDELRPSLDLLTRRMHQLIRNFDSWDLTLSLWAYAQLGYHDDAAVRALCEAALAVTPLFKPVDCANAVVAFAYLDYLHTELLRQIVAVVLDTLDDFQSGELCQVLWGFAKLGCHPGATLLHEVVGTMHRSIRQYGTQELVLVLWSLVRLGHKPGVRFLYDVETALLQRLPHMTPADLSLSVWTFAHLRYKAVRLLDEVPAAVGPQLRNCSNAELCSLASGFATAHHYHRVLLDAVAGVVLSRIEALTHQEVCVVLWTYGTFRHRPAHADFSKQMAATLYGRMPYFSPQGLAMIVKALAQLQWRSEPLLVALTAAAEAKLNAFKPLELSQLLWGLTALDCKDLNIYYAVVRRCIAILKDPQHPHYRTMRHHRVVNSVISSCQQLGYVPWTLIDFAESKGIRVKEPGILSSRDEDDEGMVVPPLQPPGASAAAAAASPAASLAWAPPPGHSMEGGRGPCGADGHYRDDDEEEDGDVGSSMYAELAGDLALSAGGRQRRGGGVGPLLQLQQQARRQQQEAEDVEQQEECSALYPQQRQQQQEEGAEEERWRRRRLGLVEPPTPLDQHAPLRIGFPHHPGHNHHRNHNHHNHYNNQHNGHGYIGHDGYHQDHHQVHQPPQQQQLHAHALGGATARDGNGDSDGQVGGDGGRGGGEEVAAQPQPPPPPLPKVLSPRPRAPRRPTAGGPAAAATAAAAAEATPLDSAHDEILSSSLPLPQQRKGRQKRQHWHASDSAAASQAAPLPLSPSPPPPPPPQQQQQPALQFGMRGHVSSCKNGKRSHGSSNGSSQGRAVPESACVSLER